MRKSRLCSAAVRYFAGRQHPRTPDYSRSNQIPTTLCNIGRGEKKFGGQHSHVQLHYYGVGLQRPGTSPMITITSHVLLLMRPEEEATRLNKYSRTTEKRDGKSECFVTAVYRRLRMRVSSNTQNSLKHPSK